MTHRSTLLRGALLAAALLTAGCDADRLEPTIGAPEAVRASAVAGMYAVEFIATAATGADMNNAGDVIGTSYLDTGCGPFCLPPQETVAWRGGTRIVLPAVPGLSGIYPGSINNQGVIAGVAGIPGVNTRAAVWTPSGAGYTVQDLGALPGMSTTTTAGIDEQGRVVGWSSTGGAIPTAAAPYLWSASTGMVNLATQGYPNDIPEGMSPGGAVSTATGWYQLGNPASFTPLPAPPAGFFGASRGASAINDNGDQARFLITSGSQNLVYLYRLPRGGAWQQLSGIPTGHLTGYGVGGINDALDITGTVSSTGVVAGGPTGLAQGILGLISPAYGARGVGGGGPLNASGQMLASVYFGTSPRLVRLTPASPCGASCLLATATLTAQFVQDPGNPGSCFQGGSMYNQASASVTVTDENGAPLASAVVNGRFMDDYWTSHAVTGTTNAAGVVSFSDRGPCGVGSIEFLVEKVTLGGRTFDKTRGALAKSVIPSVTPPTNQPPVASFTWSCTGLACSFNGTGSTDPDGTITGYTWKMSSGTTVSTAASFSRTFPSARTFALTLTVTDNNGATSSVTKTVTVTGGGTNQPPVASFTWSCTTAHACTFNGTGSTDPDGTITGYSWKLANGTTVATAASFSRTFPSARTLALTLTVTDNGGATHSTTQTVTVP
ncbi:MAG: PKD domain-containing protein [Gemmatimonadetes bacterium]|nr:PKD domain-containing protein [Gemmatimonadota bacterium]MBK7715426.1 PKD domain-containing protein [Gemmatimonadota bacterium]MBK7923287.1 PKD domain-containing protein [Gemmatimonadota bacterium]MBK9692671.1 PKD domain-containing protein [Gemmatimonadota bacterium]